MNIPSETGGQEYWRRRRRGEVANDRVAGYMVPRKLAFLRQGLAAAGLELRDRSVLDLGCGSGNVSNLVVELGGRVTGVDISATNVETARSRVSARFVESDALAFESAVESFDVVVLSSFLQHVMDDGTLATLVSRIESWLAPGGTVVFLDTAPNRLPRRDRGMSHRKLRTLDQYDDIFGRVGLGRAFTRTYPTWGVNVLSRSRGLAPLWLADLLNAIEAQGYVSPRQRLLLYRKVVSQAPTQPEVHPGRSS